MVHSFERRAASIHGSHLGVALTSCKRLMLVLLPLAGLLLFASQDTQADGGWWQVQFDSDELDPGEEFSLYNIEVDQYVTYGVREYGINLVWDPDSPRNFEVEREDGDDGDIRFGELVALRETDPRGGYIR